MRRKTRRGFTLIETLVVIGIILTLIALVVAAVVRVRAAADRTQCLNRMKQLGLALHQYHDSRNTLPPGCADRSDGASYPNMGWQTHLLPYFDRVQLWNQAISAFSTNPIFWDRPPHVGDQRVRDYLCPSESREVHIAADRAWAGFTSYLGVEGTNQDAKDGVLFYASNVKFDSITDGLSQTVVIGERPPSADGSLGWWYAGWGQSRDGSAEMILGAREIPRHRSLRNCPPDSTEYRAVSVNHQCDALHFWSLHSGGAHFTFADGSCRFLAYTIGNRLPALATRAGGIQTVIPDP